MKNRATKLIALTLCVVLLLGTVGTAVSALTNESTGSDREDQDESEVQKETTSTSAVANANKKVSKEETVYVLAGADGEVQKIIVSDWLQNASGANTLEDVSELFDIENIKGDESYTLGSDNGCVWDAQGNDIYYQGSIEKELPVQMSVRYTLDGQAITPEALAGQSGHVTIRFDYQNMQYEEVTIGGKTEKIYVPFAMLTGMVLDTNVFRNVTVSNGKLINEGSRIAVVGVAFPGLQENLAISKDTLDICGSASDCHTTNGIKFLAGFASCIWLVMICVCLFQHDQITVDSVLNFTPKNPVLAVVVLLLFFALKSISIFFFAGILYAAAGILFPLPIAILVNILGTAIMVTIPYYIGKFAGTPLVNQILRRYPKAGLLKRIRAGNDFIFCFVARLINVLPCDLVSMYMGAIQLDYGSYITRPTLLRFFRVMPDRRAPLRDMRRISHNPARSMQSFSSSLCTSSRSAYSTYSICSHGKEALQKRALQCRNMPAGTQTPFRPDHLTGLQSAEQWHLLFCNYWLPVGIQQRRQSAAVAILYIQVIHTGFLIDINDSLFKTGGMNLFVYHFKTIFHVVSSSS